MNAQTRHSQIVCFGEVLWDIFPEHSYAGGAPFNVTYNLNKLGTNTRMISAVGTDTWGKDLLQIVNDWNIDSSSIQVTPTYDTGKVFATISSSGDATYDIRFPAAWDYIQLEEKDTKLVLNSDAFVFGSLSTRDATSKETLHSLIKNANYVVFDINLRQPYVDRAEIEYLLSVADLLKINEAEIKTVLEWNGIPHLTEQESLSYLCEKYALKEIILTKGAEGAAFYNKKEYFSLPAIRVIPKDTVGSGDSFLAGYLNSIFSQQLNNKQAIQNAIILSAFITTQQGACPPYTLEDLIQFQKNY